VLARCALKAGVADSNGSLSTFEPDYGRDRAISRPRRQAAESQRPSMTVIWVGDVLAGGLKVGLVVKDTDHER
jgi:hypothetical protein